MNILLTGAGAPGAAGIIKCLRKGDKEMRIICADTNSMAYGQTFSDAFYVIPKAEEISFIEKIKDICQKENIQVIIPIVTRELPIFARNNEWFMHRHIHVCVQNKKTLETVNNKYLLMVALKEAGIQTPQFYLCSDIDQFKTAIKKLAYPQKTVCFKPVISNGSRGFRVISSSIDEASLLFNEKPNTTYLSYESSLRILSNCIMPQLVVMEYLPGDEWSVDCLVDHGKTLYAIPRLRNKMNGGISIDATVIENKQIINLSEQICALFNIHGNIGIQFKQDENGIPQILEINPRLQGTTVISAAAGVNLPYFGILLCIAENIPYVIPHWGLRMCRYWEEVYFDIDGQSFTYHVF